jgi:hypothetical protein
VGCNELLLLANCRRDRLVMAGKTTLKQAVIAGGICS